VKRFEGKGFTFFAVAKLRFFPFPPTLKCLFAENPGLSILFYPIISPFAPFSKQSANGYFVEWLVLRSYLPGQSLQAPDFSYQAIDTIW
jgi:hypothetical protein